MIDEDGIVSYDINYEGDKIDTRVSSKNAFSNDEKTNIEVKYMKVAFFNVPIGYTLFLSNMSAIVLAIAIIVAKFVTGQLIAMNIKNTVLKKVGELGGQIINSILDVILDGFVGTIIAAGLGLVNLVAALATSTGIGGIIVTVIKVLAGIISAYLYDRVVVPIIRSLVVCDTKYGIVINYSDVLLLGYSQSCQ